jgi:membrane-associated phospholipid phosphatase
VTEEATEGRPATLAARWRNNAQAFGTRFQRMRASRRGRERTRALVAGVTVMSLALVVLAAVTLDTASVAWASGLPTGVRAFFAWVTRWGKSDWLLIPSGVVVIVLFWGDWQAVDRRVAAAWAEIGALVGTFFVAIAASGLTVDVVKAVIGRARPVRFAEGGPFGFHPFSFTYALNGFPSGHATTMGAALMVAALLSWTTAAPVFVLAALVAVSRVAIGAHYPSDVAAGFLFGAAYAYFLAVGLAKGRIGFTVDLAGRPRPRMTAVRRVLRRPTGLQDLFSGLWSALAGQATRNRRGDVRPADAEPPVKGD